MILIICKNKNYAAEKIFTAVIEDFLRIVCGYRASHAKWEKLKLAMAFTEYNKITYRNRAIAIQVSCGKIRIFEIDLACEITKIEFPVLGIVLCSDIFLFP